MGQISQSEFDDLKALEKVIREGKQAFLEVGNALMEIRERKLYLAEHRSFAAYVEEVHGFKRRNAYQLIDAANFMNNLEDVRNCAQITNESQAREVAKAPPEKQAEVVERAVSLTQRRGKSMTAKVIEEAREEVVSESAVPTWDQVDFGGRDMPDEPTLCETISGMVRGDVLRQSYIGDDGIALVTIVVPFDDGNGYRVCYATHDGDRHHRKPRLRDGSGLTA